MAITSTMQQPQSTNSAFGGSHASQPRYSCSTDGARRLIMMSVLTLFTLSAASFIAWLALHPHNPTFQVNSFNVSNFTLSDSKVFANYKLELAVRNPNQKINMVFERVEILVLYGKTKLLCAIEREVELRKLNQTMVRAELGKDSGSPVDRRAIEGMGRDWRKGVVCFSVKMKVSADFKAGEWPTKQRSLDVSCNNLKVRFSSSPNATGNLMNKGSDCEVEIV